MGVLVIIERVQILVMELSQTRSPKQLRNFDCDTHFLVIFIYFFRKRKLKKEGKFYTASSSTKFLIYCSHH